MTAVLRLWLYISHEMQLSADLLNNTMTKYSSSKAGGDLPTNHQTADELMLSDGNKDSK